MRYQLENSEAAALITDGAEIADINLGGLPDLKHLFTTRRATGGSRHFAELLKPSSAPIRVRNRVLLPRWRHCLIPAAPPDCPKA